MKAYIATKEHTLECIRVDKPEPKSHEIRIKTAAAGVNRADVFQVQGSYRAPKGGSPILGLEVAGTVDKVGNKVTKWQEGDLVCALLAGGGYAEYVTVDASHVLPVPKVTDTVQAAALPEVFATVWYNIVMQAKLKQRETLLIPSASSGIGVAALQVAQVIGCKVIATTSSDNKIQQLEQLGLDRVTYINYQNTDVLSYVKNNSDSKGVDVILDSWGGEYLETHLKLLNPYGRLMLIALLKGSVCSFGLGRVLLKNLRIEGTTIRGLVKSKKAQIIKQMADKFWPCFDDQILRPVIQEIIPFDDAQVAHQKIQKNAHVGKFILQL